MLSSVTPPVAASAELLPALDDAAAAPARGPSRPRAVVTLLPGLAPEGERVLARATTKASTAAAPPRGRPTASGYATGITKALAAAVAKTTAGGTASKATSTASSKPKSSAKKAGPLAFLDDPKLSVEEKLLKLLGYLNDKWNKDLDKKMKELKTTGGTASTGSSGSSSSGTSRSSGLGGALGSIVSMAKDVMPGIGIGLELLSTPAVRSTLSSVAGPGLAALATAAGLPELAPLALQYGPEIVDAAASAAKDASATPSSAVTTSTSSGSSSSSSASASGIGSDRDAQLKLMEIQRIMDQQKEMFSLTSNLLRTGHDARMAVIQNLR